MIKSELKFLGRNKLLLFVMIVILLIPFIYAGMFLSSMWDPYGEISKLPVAVVNQDVAVKYNGKTLSVGDNLEKSLKGNDSMSFHVTDAKTAKKGLQHGKYYMVITIPKDFSKNASSMLGDKPEKMKLKYTTNPGYNYISSKLSESAMKDIKAKIMSEVTTTYTEAVFASISDMGDGFSQAADGTSKLLTGMDSLSAGTDKLAGGTKQLQEGSKALLGGVKTMKKQMDQSLSAENVSQIKTASSSLGSMNDSIQKLNTAVNGDGTEGNKGIDISGISATAQSVGNNLQTAGGNLNNAASNLVGEYAATGKATDLGGGAQKVVMAYRTLAGLYQDPSLTAAQRGQIAQAMQALYDSNNQIEQNTAYDYIVGAATSVKSAGGNIQSAGNSLTGLAQSDMSGQVDTLKSSVNQLATASNQLLPASSKAMDSMLSGLQNVQTGLGQTMKKDGKTGIVEGMSALNAGINNLNTGIAGENGLQSGVTSLRDGTASLDTALNNGAKTVADSAVTDSNIDMFVTPLTTEETQITAVANNGHAMAAYMMSVGLWVGCLAFCLMYPLVAYRSELKNGFSWFASKAVVVYPMAIIMGIILYFALHVVNGFQPSQTGTTILVSVVSAICFMTMMYFFNALLGKVGSFLMLVFMVLQLAGSAGTYPIEISGKFAAAIHKYVPFTYTVNAFRSAISGGTNIGSELRVLVTLAIIFMVLTVMLFVYRANRIKMGKPIFYRWIEEHGLA